MLCLAGLVLWTVLAVAAPAPPPKLLQEIHSAARAAEEAGRTADRLHRKLLDQQLPLGEKSRWPIQSVEWRSGLM